MVHRMERQNIGFKFEKLVFSHLNNTVKSDGYTDENDGYIYIGDDCIRMSIKTVKNRGELCLGSMHRIVHDTDPLLMAIGWYTGQNMPHKVSVYYLSN